MKSIVRFLVLVFAALVGSMSAYAGGSSPGLHYGQIPTAAQWNSYFASKLDYTPGSANAIPYWDGSGNLLNAPISGDCSSAANVFTCTIGGAGIHAATSKTTPVDADELPIADSATTPTPYGLKKLTFANLKAWEAINNASQIQSGSSIALTATLTGTEYAATPSPAITAYAANQAFDITFDSACPASPTLKLNGIATPPNLVRQNVDGTYSNLAAGAFPAGWRSTVRAISASQVLVDRLPPRATILTATHDSTLASGTKTISGSGFKASKARVRMDVFGTPNFSVGAKLGSVEQCIFGNQGGVSGAIGNTTAAVGVSTETAANYVTFSVASLDSNGITFNYVKTGTPTATVQISVDLEE